MLARPQARIIAVASLAGLLFGFDTAVISGATQALRDSFSLAPAGLGLAVSAALWGTLLGALALGKPGDRFGSRTILRGIGVVYVLCAIGSALAWNLPSFLAFRFLIGIAIGGSSVLAPVYIAEVSPAGRRGSLVSLFQVNIVVGILLAYVSNYVVALVVTDPQAWRWKFAVAAVPAGVFLLALCFIPHSPRWLISQCRIPEAVTSLARLGVADPAAAITAITGSEHKLADGQGATLSWTQHHRPIILAIGLALFNQLSGINAILYYLGDIFHAAGFSTTSSDAQSIVIGITNLLGTLLGTMLIDRAGRRQLLLVGSIGTGVAQIGVAVIMSTGLNRGLLLPLLIVFILSFAVSQGAVIWVYLSEIFPTAVRARGQGVGSATHWIANALIAGTFPAVAASSHSLPFAFFGLMMLVQFVLVLRFLPETKGVALEDMATAIGGRIRASSTLPL